MSLSSFNEGLKEVFYSRFLSPPKGPSWRVIQDCTPGEYGFHYHYDELFQWREIDYVALEKICEGASGRILDLGGGTGVVAEKLVQLGHHVVLVDHSPSMLRIAMDRRCAMAEHQQRRFEIYQQDIRHLNLSGDFSRILALGGPLTFLNDETEILNVLLGLKNILAPGGLFYMMFFSLDFWKNMKNWKKNRWQYWFGKQTVAGYTHTWIRTRPGDLPHQVEFDYAVSSKIFRYWQASSTVCYWENKKWLTLVEQAQFKIHKFFADWSCEISNTQSNPTDEDNLLTIKAA